MTVFSTKKPAKPKEKSPNIESAAITARVISRRLKAAGFEMAEVVSNKYTRGFTVHRVGCSRSVSLYFSVGKWTTNQPISISEEGKMRSSEYARARKYLTECGYEFDGKGWIVCNGP